MGRDTLLNTDHWVPAAYDCTSQVGSRHLCWRFQLPKNGKRLLSPNVCQANHIGEKLTHPPFPSRRHHPAASCPSSCLPLATESTWKAKNGDGLEKGIFAGSLKYSAPEALEEGDQSPVSIEYNSLFQWPQGIHSATPQPSPNISPLLTGLSSSRNVITCLIQ